ncbi:hypothetical protein CEXT_778941 [Caerostris extrusa]|uniref:Uncharacterized protein n=1 Tax=Caerostris extrusa TaxID=172846 RepID=A0AAV4XU19_CAEEX|nr:hypothetical protein CEXT_778941 [Caerostris extrusa]
MPKGKWMPANEDRIRGFSSLTEQNEITFKVEEVKNGSVSFEPRRNFLADNAHPFREKPSKRGRQYIFAPGPAILCYLENIFTLAGS